MEQITIPGQDAGGTASSTGHNHVAVDPTGQSKYNCIINELIEIGHRESNSHSSPPLQPLEGLSRSPISIISIKLLLVFLHLLLLVFPLLLLKFFTELVQSP